MTVGNRYERLRSCEKDALRTLWYGKCIPVAIRRARCKNAPRRESSEGWNENSPKGMVAIAMNARRPGYNARIEDEHGAA
jgi:hypothetical protein